MVNIDEAFQVTYKKNNSEFQVLVDFEKLQEFKKKPEEISVYDVLASQKIFKDQKKGELASENILEKEFENLSEEDILKEILIKGECQIPTSYNNKMREEKKLQVINYIAENSINPTTKGRYTQSMVESAVSKIKYNFDAQKDYVNQANEVLKLIKTQMPISMETVLIEAKIPGSYCGAFYGPFRKMGTIKKEYYDNEGNLRLHIEVMESGLDKIITFIKEKTNSEGEYHTLRE